jgi:hypothetical protein
VTETNYLCSLIRPLVSKHRYGAPIVKDELVHQAAFKSHEEGTVRDAYKNLQQLPFILNLGTRGVMIDSSEFESLVNYLYEECNWPTWEVTTKIKHYEGWANHDWI